MSVYVGAPYCGKPVMRLSKQRAGQVQEVEGLGQLVGERAPHVAHESLGTAWAKGQVSEGVIHE